MIRSFCSIRASFLFPGFVSYAFGKQIWAAQWNLRRLADAFQGSQFLNDGEADARTWFLSLDKRPGSGWLDDATTTRILGLFRPRFARCYTARVRLRLGLQPDAHGAAEDPVATADDTGYGTGKGSNDAAAGQRKVKEEQGSADTDDTETDTDNVIEHDTHDATVQNRKDGRKVETTQHAQAEDEVWDDLDEPPLHPSGPSQLQRLVQHDDVVARWLDLLRLTGADYHCISGLLPALLPMIDAELTQAAGTARSAGAIAIVGGIDAVSARVVAVCTRGTATDRHAPSECAQVATEGRLACAKTATRKAFVAFFTAALRDHYSTSGTCCVCSVCHRLPPRVTVS